MNRYRITGKAGTTNWIEAELGMDVRDELARRYNNLAKRAKLPPILHAPGAVSGDMYDTRNHSVHGARDGHGIVILQRLSTTNKPTNTNQNEHKNQKHDCPV